MPSGDYDVYQEDQRLLNKNQQKKKVLIIGAGAAGMACASSLAQYPDKFDVTLIERQEHTGGQATSIAVNKEKFGADYLNDGVQGGGAFFAHTYHWFKEMGYEPTKVDLQISFGKGKEGFWSNVFPSYIISKYEKDIKKFGRCLKTIRRFELIFALIPIHAALPMLGLSKGFGDNMIYPLMALFLGTGNQTPYVGTAILERLFTDPNMRLWDYSDKTLLPNIPSMYAFPKLQDFYWSWHDYLKNKGVNIRLNTEVVEIVSRSSKGVVVKTRQVPKEDQGKWVAHPNVQQQPSKIQGDVTTESYDELSLCVLACDALKLLGKTASWMERTVLGSAPFFDDVSVTHNDVEYMEKHYENHFNEELLLPQDKRDPEDDQKIEWARKNFRPFYYTYSYPQDKQRIEMCFNCSAYQGQFPRDLQFEDSIFQTIFLDKRKDHLWTKNEINPEKIIMEKWWHALGHNWTLYVKTVPWMMFLQGKRNTYYAGSWNIVNMHEAALASGHSVAWRLGADHPFNDNESAIQFFKLFTTLNHGKIYKTKPKKKGALLNGQNGS